MSCFPVSKEFTNSRGLLQKLYLRAHKVLKNTGMTFCYRIINHLITMSMLALEKNVLSSVGVSVQWMNSSRHDWLIMTKENLAFIIRAFCMPYSLLVGCSYARLFSWSFTPNDHTHSAVMSKKKVNIKIQGMS